MTALQPYLIFNGNCESAFGFYQSVFGGEVSKMRFKDAPPEACQPGQVETEGDKIMHISLPVGEGLLMGSDCPASFGEVVTGTNFNISITVPSEEEANRVFNGLAAGGTVTMPMGKTFWGSYFGMATDKFGIQWMVSHG